IWQGGGSPRGRRFPQTPAGGRRPPSNDCLDDHWATTPDRRHTGLATAAIGGRIATNVAAQLTGRAVAAEGAAGHERGSGHQVTRSLALSSRQGRKKLRRVECRGRRLGHELSKGNEDEEGQENETETKFPHMLHLLVGGPAEGRTAFKEIGASKAGICAQRGGHGSRWPVSV